MNRRALLSLVTLLAGCGGTPRASGPDDGTDSSSPTVSRPPDGASFGYTHHGPDGNRLVEGTGALRDADPVDVAVDGTPAWVVGVAGGAGNDAHWVVVLDDGRVVGIRTTDGSAERVDLAGPPRDGPPLLVGGDDPALAPRLGSETTHPVPVADGWAFVDHSGGLHLRGDTTADLALDALPDARLVRAGDRLYCLAGLTTDYGHGVLGDRVEAERVTVVDTTSGTVGREFDAPPGSVIEGIAPIVADVDGDGEREVVVTVADAERGARLVVFDGDSVRSGPAVGTGYRWRHQLAVAPFGPDGETEIAAVKTPHIGGTAEFYRVESGEVRLVAEGDGYSSHDIRSRNLDMALAGRFGGSAAGLLVPDDPKRNLAFLRRVADETAGSGTGVDEAWRLPVGGTLSSNLAAVGGDGVSLAAGRAGTVRFWLG